MILLCPRPVAILGSPFGMFCLECCFLPVWAPQWKSSIFIKRLIVGAIAVITESLDGNRVFIARLLNTNSHVLVHPVPYFDKNIGRLASLNYDIVSACPSFTYPCDLFEISSWSAARGSSMYIRLRTDYPKVPRLDSRSWLLVLRLA